LVSAPARQSAHDIIVGRQIDDLIKVGGQNLKGAFFLLQILADRSPARQARRG
jgi:hypothetical protein